MESPTHVGNTHGVLRRGSAPAVHPHACGEYGPHCSAEIMQGGSSPRVWGIRSPASNRASWIAVHPHACGEYPCPCATCPCRWGSSPRVWGILFVTRYGQPIYRFIPTRVGNTCASIMRQLASSVHPHACGEYLAFPFQPRLVAGSSPRVWGIPVRPAVRLKPNRFIPTRVGNTSAFSFSNSFSAVHPHACGEYDVEPGVMHGQLGSSPRVWGIPHSYPQSIQILRFIPTRVGNTMLPA